MVKMTVFQRVAAHIWQKLLQGFTVHTTFMIFMRPYRENPLIQEICRLVVKSMADSLIKYCVAMV